MKQKLKDLTNTMQISNNKSSETFINSNTNRTMNKSIQITNENHNEE